MFRSIECGEINLQHINESVTIAGWVHRRRDHGGLIFIDLRDSKGIVQVVINPENGTNLHSTGESLRNEWVVQITGTVQARPSGTINPEMVTGEIEIDAKFEYSEKESFNFLGAGRTQMMVLSYE